MCGINLVFSDDTEAVMRMNAVSAHRGIRSRIVKRAGVTIGHVRLPIQDLSEESDQPMTLSGSTVAYVGETFNFRDFAPEARTDLPVLMDLLDWDRLGEVDGFYAIVWVNDRHVHALTDPLGKKQLYYRADDHKAISSEIEPLVSLGPVDPDELYYSMVLKWGYCAYDRTPFVQIRKIPHGQHLVFSLTGEKKYKLSSPDFFEPKRTNLLAAMRRAVRNRTVSDVPVSVLLSGGLDSTIVFELLKETGIPFTAYHVENEEAEFLKYLDFPDRVELRVLPEALVWTRELLRTNEGPVDLGSVEPQLRLAKAIRSDACHVVLSGDGADELFGGYRRAAEYDSQWSDVFCELPFYHLPRLDRIMMSQTIEMRCPFLSLPVVRHAMSLPWEQRRSKEHLKEVFQGIIPEQILHRRKKPLKSVIVRADSGARRRELVEQHRRTYFE